MVDEEDKVEFGPTGEAVGYISLDQAQVLAMRSARGEPGDYGADFNDLRMAFEVAAEEETEDHYVVTLSFRPEGRFAGVPGQEQFFIEKEGAVVHRQVLSLPEATGGRKIPIPPILSFKIAVVVQFLKAIERLTRRLTRIWRSQ